MEPRGKVGDLFRKAPPQNRSMVAGSKIMVKSYQGVKSNIAVKSSPWAAALCAAAKLKSRNL
eukprot:5728381-Prymnesium_polylepis.1